MEMFLFWRVCFRRSWNFILEALHFGVEGGSGRGAVAPKFCSNLVAEAGKSSMKSGGGSGF
jgi:hypothetical protein